MGDVATNRDLYCFIADLVKQRAECRCTLQSYLENLRRLGRNLRAREAVSPEEFAELLRAAFEPSAHATELGPAATDGYLAWENRIGEQIRDLDEMRRAGTLDNEYRYFGVDALRGGRWYNFDPCTADPAQRSRPAETLRFTVATNPRAVLIGNCPTASPSRFPPVL